MTVTKRGNLKAKSDKTMNQSILHLHLSGLHKPASLFNQMGSSSFSSFSITKSSFSRSFSNIFYSSYSPNLLNFKQSSFSKMLSSAICVDEAFNLTGQTRNQGVSIDHDKCVITRCHFAECVTKGDGGAINYHCNNGDLGIFTTLFYKNEASDNGGAISFHADKYQFYQVCIDHCKAGNAGQSFTLSPNEDLPDTINYTTVSVCAPVIFGSIQYNMHIHSGGGNFYNDNVTRGLCDRIGGALACFRTNVKQIHYTHFVSCKGAGVISLDFAREPTELMLCMIFNYTHTQSDLFYFCHLT